MSMINVGVIGCGHWGPNHVRVFSQLRDSRVVACADLDSKRLRAIGENYPHVELFEDYRELLNHSLTLVDSLYNFYFSFFNDNKPLYIQDMALKLDSGMNKKGEKTWEKKLNLSFGLIS